MIPTNPATVITDIRIPFWRLVFFLIKLTLAAIPATIIVMAILFAIGAAVAVLFGMPVEQLWRRGTMTF